jgi:hypothetical protein
MWESRSVFQEEWEGGKPVFWLSLLSIPRHFHRLPVVPVSDETMISAEKRVSG